MLIGKRIITNNNSLMMDNYLLGIFKFLGKNLYIVLILRFNYLKYT